MAKPNSDDFYLNYGKAMSAWADIELGLCGLFVQAIDPLNKLRVNAEGIFYSARSFSGRADMLKAASKSQLLTKNQRCLTRAALKRAQDYNTFRSKLAHRVTVQSYGILNPAIETHLHEGDDIAGQDAHMPSIGIDDLKHAATHFDALSFVILTGDSDEVRPPEESLQLVLQLPKEPHLRPDDRLIEKIYEGFL
jgi:hypothetical protein